MPKLSVMGASLQPLSLTNSAKLHLQKLRRRRKVGAALAFRAQIVLLAAAGVSNAEIARRLGCLPHVVGKWRSRFAAEGLPALEDRPRSGRPVSWTEQATQKVVMTVCRQPRKGLSRWSVRTLARHLELPPARVQRVLREHDLH